MCLESSFQSIDDQVLWAALKKGDEQAFTQLYQKYVRVLYSYGKKLTVHESVVADAIQDLFIDLWQMRHNLAEVTCARFYLYRSLRRKIYRHYTSKDISKQEWIETEEHQLPICPSLEEEQIHLEMIEQEQLWLKHYIKQLRPRQAEAIILYYYEGFSFVQISEIMMMNEQSARNLVQRAIHKLRQVTVGAFLLSIISLS